MNRRVFLGTYMCLIGLIVGCSGVRTSYTYIPYTVDPNRPTATLKNSTRSYVGPDGTATIYTSLGLCMDPKKKNYDHMTNGSLFETKGKDIKTVDDIKRINEATVESVEVNVDRPITIIYNEYNKKTQRYCNVSVHIQLEPGKTYSLVGGAHHFKDKNPLFQETSGCALGVIDNSTGLLVPPSPTQKYDRTKMPVCHS